MKLTYTVYILASVAFVVMLTWMFVYNRRLKTRAKTIEKLGRPPVVPEEGIAIATVDLEHDEQPLGPDAK